MPPRRAPFQPGHALEYAVEVTYRDSKGSATAACLFCVHDGRENVTIGHNGRKRQRTGKVKLFTEPFFPHKYRSHLVSQHNERWAEYQNLSKQEKEQYFAGNARVSILLLIASCCSLCTVLVLCSRSLAHSWCRLLLDFCIWFSLFVWQFFLRRATCSFCTIVACRVMFVARFAPLLS